MRRKLLGLTGPSAFSEELTRMIEQFYNANFVMLYHNNEENLSEWLRQVDGVIVAGGVDIHPTVYNQPIVNKNNFSKFNIERDVRELIIIEHCIKEHVPMLGICRGHQMIGIYHNMEIVPDITDGDIVHTPHKQGISVNNLEPVHPVKILGDKAQEYFLKDPVPERQVFDKRKRKYDDKKDLIWVNSYHHQAIRYFKDEDKRKWNKNDLFVLGIANTGLREDKEEILIVELMYGNKESPWVSCQWHPELDYETNTPSKKVLQRFEHLVNVRYKYNINR